MTKRLITLGAFVVALLGSFYIGYSLDGVEPVDNNTDDTPYVNENGTSEVTDEVFLEVFDQLMESHYSQPEESLLMEGAITGMIEALEDPHTSYFDYEAYNSFQSGFEESYVGIGVTVSFVEDQIIVEAVTDGGPADQAGIMPNDIIVSVDGTDITGNNLYDTIQMVLGEEGTDVTVGLVRSGVENVIILTMTRAVILNSSVNFTTYDKHGETYGYIEVTMFGDETATKFQNAIIILEAQNIDGLVVDLRNNGGGHLGTVIDMLDTLLPDNGKKMFSTSYYLDGEYAEQSYYATGDIRKDYDIVTLVNENSASASEVFASAMQEHSNYAVVGTVTYGKGTMQTDKVITATVGDRLHLSIGQWFTSDGNWVHFNGGTDGVTPDIIIEPSLYEKAYKVFLIDEAPLAYDVVDMRVANIQLILNTMGYTVRTDGYFDASTLSAVLDIQATHGLEETGQLNDETLLVINEALDAYKNDPLNDSQLQAAFQYLNENND